MKFDIFCELSYKAYSPATFIFNIQAARTRSQTVIEESLVINPSVLPVEFTLKNNDSRFIKLAVDQEMFFTISYRAVVDVQHILVEQTALLQAPVALLPNEVLSYLFPSRYCQSDKLRKFASKEFGYLCNDFDKACAITDWIFKNIDYIAGATDSGTSAYDTLIRREGVCKDFAHLGIALSRALDIPARYFTGYACNLYPPDFHACFEVYIGGYWIFFDPTRLVPLNGLVKIANSKDAADAAVANFFGNTSCAYMNVQCATADLDFRPSFPGTGNARALSYK